MKDNFSKQAESYARHRPGYPSDLISYLLGCVKGHACAWDCGTGNGQFATLLAPHFARVMATDISATQLSHAPQIANVQYICAPAGDELFEDASCDLITVAQAIHWFDFEAFYRQVNRVLKPGGILAVIGYGLVKVDPAVDKVVADLYHRVLKGYWDAERSYIDEHYMTIPFPFTELQAPRFESHYRWSCDDFLGYLGTWSAVQHYRDKNTSDPIALIREDLCKSWGQGEKEVRFPILLRVGTK